MRPRVDKQQDSRLRPKIVQRDFSVLSARSAGYIGATENELAGRATYRDGGIRLLRSGGRFSCTPNLGTAQCVFLPSVEAVGPN